VVSARKDDKPVWNWDRLRAPTTLASEREGNGYRFEGESKTVAISGDTIACDGIDRIARGADLLVHCCYMASAEIENDHFRRVMQYTLAGGDTVGKIASRAKVKTLVLTHHRPRKDDRMLERLVEEVARDFSGRIIVGEDLTEIELVTEGESLAPPRNAMIQAAKARTSGTVRLVQDSYKDAGVDTDEADAGLKKLSARIEDTWPPDGSFGAVKLGIGYFANVVDMGGQGVAITTDGVGSKAMIAHRLNKYKTIGIDCVAMNVNDLLCVGAEPVSMVDYLATKKVDANFMDDLAIGLAEGAKLAGISICGGETAQLRDMIEGFDLAGTAIGRVPLDKILIGQNIERGDVVIGVASNGIHSNGLSLARQAFLDDNKYSLSHQFPELERNLGDELLRPTYIYVKEALELLKQVKSVKALIHITSDGLLNLLRVQARAEYVIERLPPTPAIFSLIQKLEKVDDARMFEVFNMGIGFCAIVGNTDSDLGISILRNEGKEVFRIGYVKSIDKRRVLIPELNLVGEGKHFRRADS